MLLLYVVSSENWEIFVFITQLCSIDNITSRELGSRRHLGAVF